MKILIIVLLAFSFAASSHAQVLTAKTEDGKKVILKEDKTWKFADTGAKKGISEEKKCELQPGRDEPKSNVEIAEWLEKYGLTIDNLKKQVAVENDVSIENIQILKVSESKSSGIYDLCVDGEKMRYCRTKPFFHREKVNPIAGL